jgi:hypothetical protein
MSSFREYCTSHFDDVHPLRLKLWESCLEAAEGFPWRDAVILEIGSPTPIWNFAVEQFGARSGRLLNHLNDLKSVADRSVDIVVGIDIFARVAREPVRSADGQFFGPYEESARRVLQGIARTAREGARVLLTATNAASLANLWNWIDQRPTADEYPPFTPGSLQKICAAAGLACLKIETLDPGDPGNIRQYQNQLALQALSRFGASPDLRGHTIVGVFVARQSLIRD